MYPLTHSSCLPRMKRSLTTLGIDHSKYSGHSFRRGGASLALECDISPELTQTQGDWDSDAHKAYLDPSLAHRQKMMSTFATALPPSPFQNYVFPTLHVHRFGLFLEYHSFAHLCISAFA